MPRHKSAPPPSEAANSDLPVSTTDANASTVANAPAPLLVSRKKARHLLGDVHNSTLWRWEKAGILQPIRINQSSKQSAVFYRMSDLLRLIQGN